MAIAWESAKRLSVVWRYQLDDKTKLAFFQANVQSVLLYGCETWTLTKALEKRLDGTYTKLLRYITGTPWQTHVPNEVLYQGMKKISVVIRERRLRFFGHCVRAVNQPVSSLVLWRPQHVKFKRGGGARKTYIKQVTYDVAVALEMQRRAAAGDLVDFRERYMVEDSIKDISIVERKFSKGSECIERDRRPIYSHKGSKLKRTKR